MKTDTASGGGGRGGRRRGLLLFALLLVVAQVVLFIFLRLRKDGEAARAAAPPNRTDLAMRAQSETGPSTPAPRATPLPVQAPHGARTVANSEPGNQPLDGPGNRPAESDDSAAADDQDSDDRGDGGKSKRAADKHDRDKADRDKADRDRERRDRADRDREARDRARLEAERDKAKLEAEKDRARLEAERAEKARLETERERAKLEAERARLAEEKSQLGAAQEVAQAPAPAARPSGSPDVLVVVVSSRAGGGGLSREEIRNIYFGKTTFWSNNTPVRAYNRPAGSAAGRKFFRSVLGTSAGAFREHWNELQLSGGGIAPATVSSAESIVARVAGASGAIGYVLESELPADVSGVRLIRFK